MRVAQFVHEPLAALYGFIRGAKDPEEMARRLARRNVLVVDWGGGTLDLTLCRVDEEQVRQLRNGGSAQVGGDEFDKVIRDEVVKRVPSRGGMADDDLAIPEAELRLLQDAERNKIELSADRVERDVLPPELLPVRHDLRSTSSRAKNSRRSHDRWSPAGIR